MMLHAGRILAAFLFFGIFFGTISSLSPLSAQQPGGQPAFTVPDDSWTLIFDNVGGTQGQVITVYAQVNPNKDQEFVVSVYDSDGKWVGGVEVNGETSPSITVPPGGHAKAEDGPDSNNQGTGGTYQIVS